MKTRKDIFTDVKVINQSKIRKIKKKLNLQKKSIKYNFQ